MIVIDGSQGEGGGQILRTSLSLSLVSGKPFRLTNIRAKRRKPGIMRQHLTAIHAALEISESKAEKDQLGSSELSFFPGKIKGGNYEFSIGTAGSTMLVLQTLLPALIFADKKSNIAIGGGTHNPFSPPFDFIEKSFVPYLKKMGVELELKLERPGFYPKGGGIVRAQVSPCENLKQIELKERGDLKISAKALVSGISRLVAEKELAVVKDFLQLKNKRLILDELPSEMGPGNALMIFVESSNGTDVFTGFGEQGVPAEKIGKKTANEAKWFINSGAQVGAQLADQLLLYMAMAGGGSFTTHKVTDHLKSNCDVIKAFTGVDFTLNQLEKRVGVTLTKGDT